MNNNHGNPIDVDYIEIDDREYFTIEEVAQKMDIEIGQIIYWCNKFDDILKINSIGQFKIFSKEDLRNLTTIKELNVDKEMSIREIREYFNSHTTAIVVKKEKELDTSIFNFFSNIIETQNKKIDQLLETQNKALKVFSHICNEIALDSTEKNKLLNKIIDEQKQQRQTLDTHQSNLKDYVTTTITESTESINNSIDEKLESKLESFTHNISSEMRSYLEEKQKDQEIRDLELVDTLNSRLEQQRNKYLRELEQQNNKSFLQKLFGKKS